jgi:hypothetical protein
VAAFVFASLLFCYAAIGEAVSKPFVHPGLLHSAADLDRMRTNVAQGIEPWAGAWRAFTNGNRWIATDYKPRPLEVVGRGVGSTGQANISGDCTAAYYNAIAWMITGEERFARKSVEIMNAWSYECREINGKDAVLCAGIYGYKLLNAAEIIRATYKEWPEKDVEQFKHLMRDVFYPIIADFATFANGNWDAAAELTMISMGVFLDDRAMFDRAARYYLAGSGDGSLLYYIINDTGQLQETGRDQQHSQLGIGLLSCVAETAWHQGVDLYGAYDNRLLKGFEYTARYNLGEEVPFTATHDRTGKYNHQKASERGRPDLQIYEMVFNHYSNRVGIPVPYTAKVAAAQRPESLAVDQVGGGTLLFSLPEYKAAAPNKPPAIPGPVIALSGSHEISLSWAASVGSSSYTVSRADKPEGPFRVIAKDVKLTTYTDNTPRPWKVVYYTVSAANSFGASDDTLLACACIGLPTPWSQRDVGDVGTKGFTQFDGSIFTLEGSGSDIGGKSNQFQFAYVPMRDNGAIVARYVPQTPSQFAKMGLMLRESESPESAMVALLITPVATTDIEVPQWHLELLVRSGGGVAISTAIGPALEAPFVTWGRLMAPFYLRLNREGNKFIGSFSADGKKWTEIGSTTMNMSRELIGGLAACSRIQVSTTVMFDHVTAPGWKQN